jgi:hypothetical protein
MAYAILRVGKIKSPDVKGANAHNTREITVSNADPQKVNENVQLKGSIDLEKDIKKRLEDAGITKYRKDAVLCIEHMMTTSPEFLEDKNPQKWGKFQNECQNWLNTQYGEENVINIHAHFDEKTPHIHAMVTPITQDGRLACKDFLNGADKLRKMQDSFAEHIQKSGLELERGEKGSKATHTEIKEFYSHIQKANDLKTQKTEINIQAPKIEISKPPLFGNFEKYKTNTEQEIQQQVNSIQEDTHKIVLDALKPLQSINALLLEESRLKTRLDSENQQLRRMLFNSNQENQKLKEENTKLKGKISFWANNCKITLHPNFKINEETRNKYLKQAENVIEKYTPKTTIEPKKQAEKPKEQEITKKEEKIDLKEKVTTGEKKEEPKKSVQKYTSIKKSKPKDRGMSM